MFLGQHESLPMRSLDPEIRPVAVTGRRWKPLLLAGTTALLVPLAATAQFTPAEALASTTRGLIDPEFNQAKGQFTWVDLTGSIWVGGIDRATGALVPASGKAVLIEKGAAPSGGLGFTLNGPEWAYGADFDRIVYTRILPGTTPVPANARVGTAWQQSDGSWTRRTMSSDLPRNGPYGSEEAGDPAPRITYNDAAGNHYWRELLKPGTEAPLPGLPQAQFPVARFARGERSAVYPVKVDNVTQAFRYQLDSQVLEQMTFDGGEKEQPWAWRAPDFNNEMVLMTTVAQSTLVLYRQGLDSSNPTRWLPWTSLQAPLGGRFFSTEPFVYGGKSYVVMMVIVGAYPTSIWVANFDGSAPLLRRITPELPDRARADPEVFFTDRGPVVFFGRYDQTKGSYWLCSACAEGLYRAETGIAPP
jgi:hypothetical protein